MCNLLHMWMLYFHCVYCVQDARAIEKASQRISKATERAHATVAAFEKKVGPTPFMGGIIDKAAGATAAPTETTTKSLNESFVNGMANAMEHIGNRRKSPSAGKKLGLKLPSIPKRQTKDQKEGTVLYKPRF